MWPRSDPSIVGVLSVKQRHNPHDDMLCAEAVCGSCLLCSAVFPHEVYHEYIVDPDPFVRASDPERVQALMLAVENIHSLLACISISTACVF